MKNWDPLSIFKYLCGGPTIHLSMFLLLTYSEALFENEKDQAPYLEEKGQKLFANKKVLIRNMLIVHMACFISHMLFEGGIWQFFCCIRGKSVILPTLSMFIQIVTY